MPSFLNDLLKVVASKKGSLDKKETLNFFFHIAKALKVGYSIEKAIETWPCPRSRSHQVRQILVFLRNGKSFSEALKLANFLSPLYYGVIEAAEVVGNLAGVMDDLHRSLKNYLKLEAEIKKPLVMPIVELVLGFGIFNAVMLHILPKLASSIMGMAADIPDVSKTIFEISMTMARYKLFIYMFYMLIPIVLYFTKDRWEGLVYRLPFLGEIKRYHFTRSFTRQLGIFMRGGVPLTSAVEKIRLNSKSKLERDYLGSILLALKRGVPFDLALDITGTKLIPSHTLIMFKVTRHTGNYVEVMDEINDLCTEMIMNKLSKISNGITFFVFFWLAALVFAMVFSVYYPIFNMDIGGTVPKR